MPGTQVSRRRLMPRRAAETDEALTRDRFIAHMRAQGILTVFHYLPLNMSPMGKRLGGRRGMCPVAEDISGRIVRMPLYYNMGDDELAKVIECATQFEA